MDMRLYFHLLPFLCFLLLISEDVLGVVHRPSAVSITLSSTLSSSTSSTSRWTFPVFSSSMRIRGGHIGRHEDFDDDEDGDEGEEEEEELEEEDTVAEDEDEIEDDEDEEEEGVRKYRSSTSSLSLSALLNPAKLLQDAAEKTLFEMSVEDLNSEHRMDDHLARRLIVLPLTEAFNPSQASGMHGKVQYGDKCSLPASLGKVIFEKPYEVPWLFEVTPVSREKHYDQTDDVPKKNSGAVVQKAFLSPLDFRSPENYIFLPKWLMDSLALKSYDLVDISFIRIKLAGLVVLEPQTLAWDAMMEKNNNLKVVLEHEVNKYSSLTAGTTILIEVDGIELPLLVKETRDEGGVAVKGVRIQDSDVKVDIERGKLDKMLEEIKKETERVSKAKNSRSDDEEDFGV